MKTVNKLPSNYPNVYFYDNDNNKFPSVTFIRFSVTPTGRRGKDFEQIRFKFKPNGENSKKTNEQIIKEAEEKTSPNRLCKGYKWGELFIQHDFSDRNFINQQTNKPCKNQFL